MDRLCLLINLIICLKVKVNKVKYRSISGQLRKPKTKRMTITIKHRPKMVSSSIRDDSFQPEAL